MDTNAIQRVFFVEDDEEIREIVLYALRSTGFESVGFENAVGFYAELERSPTLPSLVLLDIMLPGNDGLSILQKLRNSPQTKALPVIMLTAKGSEYDKVTGLDMGADDYLVKPFGVMELISRINAVLRRSRSLRIDEKLTYKNISLDIARRTVTADGKVVQLTYKEFELLYHFLLNTGLVLARNRIMEAVWGYDFAGETRTLDMHIKTLRQKLGVAGEHIKTVRNVGYKLGE
ncbi:MAG: response regulator transcription factor [Coriobacteriia bacterium]|nr:response regulator transcription factor [Coriobacteriia bacterium]